MAQCPERRNTHCALSENIAAYTYQIAEDKDGNPDWSCRFQIIFLRLKYTIDVLGYTNRRSRFKTISLSLLPTIEVFGL